MNWGGDSIEYLKLSHKMENGEFPLSANWMPLYSVNIYFVSFIFNSDLINSAKINNLFLGIFFIYMFNIYFVLKHSKSILSFIILNTSIFSYSYFLLQSITIMADFQYLVFTVIQLLIMSNLPSNNFNSRDLLKVILLAVLSFMTKYNGIINIAILGLYFLVNIRNISWKYIVILLFAIVLFYIPWLIYKPGEDFLFKTSNEFNFLKIYNEINNFSRDSIVSFFKYFSTYSIGKFVERNALRFPGFLLFALCNIISLHYFLKKIFFSNLKFQFGFINLTFLFILFYVDLIFVRQINGDISEINTRTLFVILFLISMVFSVYLVKESLNKYLKSIIVMLVLISTYSCFNYCYSTSINGIGELAENKFNNQVNSMFDYCKKLNSYNLKLYSNEPKIVSLMNNYVNVNEFPSVWQFKGNYYTKDPLVFEIESRALLRVMKNESCAVIYFYMNKGQHRYDNLQLNFLNKLTKDRDCSVYKNQFGIIVHKTF